MLHRAQVYFCPNRWRHNHFSWGSYGFHKIVAYYNLSTLVDYSGENIASVEQRRLQEQAQAISPCVSEEVNLVSFDVVLFFCNPEYRRVCIPLRTSCLKSSQKTIRRTLLCMIARENSPGLSGQSYTSFTPPPPGVSHYCAESHGGETWCECCTRHTTFAPRQIAMEKYAGNAWSSLWLVQTLHERGNCKRLTLHHVDFFLFHKSGCAS